MGRNAKPEEVKFSEVIRIRLSTHQYKVLHAKAIEQSSSISELTRQAVSNYINRNMTDSEIIHASLAENTRKMKYLENKMELLALIATEQTRFIMSVLPLVKHNTDEAVQNEFNVFMRKCGKTLKQNHTGMLESMVLDLYENQEEVK